MEEKGNYKTLAIVLGILTFIFFGTAIAFVAMWMKHKKKVALINANPAAQAAAIAAAAGATQAQQAAASAAAAAGTANAQVSNPATGNLSQVPASTLPAPALQQVARKMAKAF